MYCWLRVTHLIVVKGVVQPALLIYCLAYNLPWELIIFDQWQQLWLLLWNFESAGGGVSHDYWVNVLLSSTV